MLKFVSLAIPLNPPLRSPHLDWGALVEAELSHHGDPLRWAITCIDQEQQVARVEAVVILPNH